MSVCTRCGATFGCAMADGGTEPCWCTRLPPVVPLPSCAPASAPARTGAAPAGCWCPACLERHIARLTTAAPGTGQTD